MFYTKFTASVLRNALELSTFRFASLYTLMMLMHSILGLGLLNMMRSFKRIYVWGLWSLYAKLYRMRLMYSF